MENMSIEATLKGRFLDHDGFETIIFEKIEQYKNVYQAVLIHPYDSTHDDCGGAIYCYNKKCEFQLVEIQADNITMLESVESIWYDAHYDISTKYPTWWKYLKY